MKTEKQWGGSLVFLAGVIWGTIGPCVKLLESLGASASLSAFLRVGFACLIMLVLTVRHGGFRALCIGRRTLLATVIIGVFCQGLYNYCYSYSVTRAGVSAASILLSLAPVFSAIGSRILFAERFRFGKLAALALNVLGCMLAVTGGRFVGGAVDVIGVLAGIGAGFFYSLTPLIAKWAGDDVDMYALNTYAFLFAGIFLALFTKPFAGAAVTVPILGAGALLALIPTVFAYLLYYRGIRHINETSRIPLYASAEPVVAALLGALLFGEVLSVGKVIGLASVILSIAMTAKGK